MNLQQVTAELRNAVAEFDAATPREISSRARFLAELGRLPDPFDRDADPVHVTGSAIVVGPRGTVLHWHKRLGGWLQPGGHVDTGETPWQAALREAREETGLTLRHPGSGPRLVHLDVHPAGPHVHLDLRYLLLAEDTEPSPPPGESQQVRWFSFAEAIAMTDAALVDGLRRVAAGLPDHTGIDAVMRGFVLGPAEGPAYGFHGSTVVIKAAGATTLGQLAVLESTYPPGLSVPEHVHDGEDEMFYLLAGELSGNCETRSWVARPGSFVFVPRGCRHGFAVTSAEPARALVITGPPRLDQQIIDRGEPPP